MAIVKIRNAGEEREEEPMMAQHTHDRIIKEKEHITHLIVLQRDRFHKQALDEIKERIKLQLELERMRSSCNIALFLLAASMLGNIGLVAFG